MAEKFKVTALGLQVDKTMILPGSELRLSRPAPAHWSRFGKASREMEKTLTVATPKAASTPEKPKRRRKAAASK